MKTTCESFASQIECINRKHEYFQVVISTDRYHVATAMRDARVTAKLSLREVARWMNITPPYLSDLEWGKRNFSPLLAREFEMALKELPTLPKVKNSQLKKVLR